MFREESVWIKNALQKLKPVAGKNAVANIGSSTEHFRKVIQPHIHHNIIATLEAEGWEVFNVDLKQEPGVDLVADVTKPHFAEPFKDRFALTICTNLLEHVEDINLVVQNLVAITKPGGHILITVPYKYRIHLDPIDNGLRPTPQEIYQLFAQAGDHILDAHIISISDKSYYRIRPSRFPLWGYRERVAYYLGKRHKTSGILFSIKK
ncbi:methyltransferase domain-containing protein [Aridibaculum aurantiacum]|uniref:methyltransferase domain-containing protein n=1 Tax=Aridibaculum aurantiacum TaxID=2810307 RepID=UPI001A96CE9B|nr:methyltransferase domain-containing protein [Aridibaculum aurantiacum]